MNEYTTIISLALSGIASILAILSPLITVKLNNNHQIRLKKIEKMLDLKLEKYQKFFSLYADFYTFNKYDKEITIDIITDCLLISNDETSKALNALLKRINGEIITDIPSTSNFVRDKDYFSYCIEKMKKELNSPYV